MKKILLAVILSTALATGFSTTQAQTKAVYIENFDVVNSNVKTAVINETPFYNKAGKLLYTVKRYDASGLTKQVSRAILNQYNDFDIVGVEEITVPNQASVYFIHLANETKLKTIKVINGESTEVNNYKRA